MAINYTNLFAPFQKIAASIIQLDTEETDTFELIADNVYGSFSTGMEDIESSFGSTAYQWRRALQPYKQTLAGLTDTILGYFFYDQEQEGLINRGLPEKLETLWEYMVSDSETVLENTVTLNSASTGRLDGTSNSGNFSILTCKTHHRGHFEDYINEYIREQSVEILCTQGSESGGTDGTETWRVAGQVQDPSGILAGDDGTDDPWQYLGTMGTLTTLSEQNSLLTDSGFENWSTNTPDDWDIDAGVAGTDIYKEETNLYRGDAALEIDSAIAAVTLSQDLSGLEQETTYVLTARLRKDAANASTGTLEIAPYSASGGYTFDAAEKISISDIDTELTTSFVLHNVFFNTPQDIPDDLEIRIHCVPGGSNAKFYVDDVCLQRVTKFTGLGIVVVAGSNAAETRDRATVSIQNDYAGDIQTFFGRFFNVSLPSATSGAETISDGSLT